MLMTVRYEAHSAQSLGEESALTVQLPQTNITGYQLLVTLEISTDTLERRRTPYKLSFTPGPELDKCKRAARNRLMASIAS